MGTSTCALQTIIRNSRRHVILDHLLLGHDRDRRAHRRLKHLTLWLLPDAAAAASVLTIQSIYQADPTSPDDRHELRIPIRIRVTELLDFSKNTVPASDDPGRRRERHDRPFRIQTLRQFVDLHAGSFELDRGQLARTPRWPNARLSELATCLRRKLGRLRSRHRRITYFSSPGAGSANQVAQDVRLFSAGAGHQHGHVEGAQGACQLPMGFPLRRCQSAGLLHDLL